MEKCGLRKEGEKGKVQNEGWIKERCNRRVRKGIKGNKGDTSVVEKKMVEEENKYTQAGKRGRG